MKHLLLLASLLCVAESLAQVKKKTASPISNIVCGDYGVIDNFSEAVNPLKWHDYEVGPTKVCSTLESAACTKDNVYAMLLNNAEHIAPGAQPIPVVNCKIYNVDVFTVQGPVLIRTNYDNRTIENFTMEGHDLHPGKVTHRIVQIGNDIHLYTRGVGNGDYRLIYTNKLSAHATWKLRHLKFRHAVANRLKISVVPSEIQSRWIHEPAGGKQPAANQETTASCGFTWVPWSSISIADKAVMKKILVTTNLDSNEDLVQHVSTATRDQQKAQIARYDFFQNGQEGYLMYVEGGQLPDGNKGYVEIFENSGKSYIKLYIQTNLCAIKPIATGVKAENGQHKSFYNNLAFDREYTNFLEFNTFIKRFSSDRSFQISRIKFPLVWEEYINGTTKVVRNTQTNWRHINILTPSGSGNEVFISYPTSKKPNEARVGETCAGGDCGYGAGLGFKKIGGIWYCVSRYFGSD